MSQDFANNLEETRKKRYKAGLISSRIDEKALTLSLEMKTTKIRLINTCHSEFLYWN